MKRTWHQERLSSKLGAGAALISMAMMWSACAPRSGGNDEQQVSQSGGFDFAWGGYNWKGIVDATPPARSVDDWNATGKIRFYAKQHEVTMAKINAIHPTRAFRNVNGGPLPVDAAGYVERDENGRLSDGNVSSKEGPIQGVIVRSSQGNTGLVMNCFRSLIPGSPEQQKCSDGDGRRHLALVSQDGDDYVFKTSGGIEIARAHKKFVSHGALGTFMDPEPEAREQQDVSIVTLGAGVSVWGGVLSASADTYTSRPQTCREAMQPAEGVFKRSLPAGYTGTEYFVHDALSDASCYLNGRATSFKVRCTRYHRDPDPAKDQRFCLEAEVINIADNEAFPESAGGFGIWLVVDASSTQAPASRQDTGSEQTSQQGSQVNSGSAAYCAELKKRTECTLDTTKQCKWFSYSGDGSCVPLGTVAPEGVPDFSEEGRARQQGK